MSKIENNRIYYDPYNEIRCDKFALEKFVKESEEKDKTIADLEAKLAESEKKLQENKIGCFNTQEALFKKIKKLEQQLAEKDDELLQKEKKIQDLMLCEFVATTLDFNKLSADNCKLREQLAEHNQDKISFAVEQLEKVKEWTHDNASYVLGDFASVWEDALLDELDNQIEQLKEGK